MSTRSIALAPYEVDHLLTMRPTLGMAPTVVLVRPAFSGHGGNVVNTPSYLSVERTVGGCGAGFDRVTSPFGEDGGIVLGLERWQWGPGEVDIKMLALLHADGERRVRTGDTSRYGELIAGSEVPKRWRHARTMPSWASRWRLRVVSTRATTLKEVGNTEAPQTCVRTWWGDRSPKETERWCAMTKRLDPKATTADSRALLHMLAEDEWGDDGTNRDGHWVWVTRVEVTRT
jgi:hypothetical protein